MKLHHIEIHQHGGGKHRVEHHFSDGTKKEHVMEPEEVANHIDDALEEADEPEDMPREEAAEAPQPKPEDKHSKLAERHAGNNPMGVGRKAPVRQY